MPRNDENDSNLNKELSQFNMSLHENVIELWRTEEICRLKVKSISEIESSLTQVNIENKWLERHLHDIKSRMDEIRNNIVSYDNINISLYETLTNLEVQHTRKKFEIHKLRSDYELQLFIRTELYQKEEERLNNIPEIKSLRMAESEFESIKLEYDELLIVRENLLVNIFKAQEENDKKRNALFVNFANVYLETQSLNQREACCRTVQRKLDNEYKEKLNVKNSLLLSEKKKIKTPTWTNTFYPLDSNIINLKLDSMEQYLKPSFKYSNYNPDFANKKKLDNENSESNKTAIKSVTFLLPSDDEISDKNVDTNLLESNLYNVTNSSTKNSIEMNVNADQFLKNVFIQPTQFTIDNKRLMNNSDINFQNNKRKKIEVTTNFEFKKPFNPIGNIIQNNTNTITAHRSTNNKNTLQKENGLIEDQDKIPSMSITNYNHYEDSCFDKNNDLRGNGSLVITEHPNLKSITPDNIKTFRSISQYDASSSDEQNKILSGLFWNNSKEPQFENSGNNSFCSADISVASGCSDNISQLYSDDVQSSFMNLFNNPSTSSFKLDHNEVNAKSLGDSGNVVFELFNKIDNKRSTSTNRSSPKGFNDDDNNSFEPIQPNFNSEQFNFNFNTNCFSSKIKKK